MFGRGFRAPSLDEEAITEYWAVLGVEPVMMSLFVEVGPWWVGGGPVEVEGVGPNRGDADRCSAQCRWVATTQRAARMPHHVGGQ